MFLGCSSILLPLSGILFSRGEYTKKGINLRIALVCIQGGICVLLSCLTFVSLRITSVGKLLRKLFHFLIDNTVEVVYFGLKMVHYKVTKVQCNKEKYTVKCFLLKKIMEILI